MSSTFIEHDPDEHITAMSLQAINLETLADAGNQQDTESTDAFSTTGNSFPPYAPAPSPASRERKATVRRRSPRQLGAQKMNIFTKHDSADASSSVATDIPHHSRRGEISAEVFSGKKAQPYRRTLVEKPDSTRALIRSAVDDCLLFAELNDSGRNEVVDAFSKISAVKAQVLIQEGDWGDLFYVLETGTCDACKVMFRADLNDKVPTKVKSYGPGGSFGELALMYNEPRAATVRVTSPSGAVLWVIDRLTYKNISVHFKVQKQKVHEEMLRNVSAFSLLSSEEMIRLVDIVDEKTVPSNETVVRAGEVTDDAVILVSGGLIYSTAKETGQVTVGEVFNEQALFKQVKSSCTLHTADKQTAVVLTLSRARVEEIFGPMSARVQPAAGTTSVAGGKPTRPMSVAMPKSNANHRHHIAMKFEDLETNMMRKPAGGVGGSGEPNSPMLQGGGRPGPALSTGSATVGGIRPSTSPGNAPGNNSKELVLGVGTFGKVIICKHTPTGETYAMKKLIKSWIVENCLEQHVVDERNVMTLTDHPFILKLHSSFWDERYVYLVLELCLGGELFMYLRKYDKFNEQQARFYAASIVQAFEHLHNKSIIYRDLKPENLMLDDNGFLKVVDFGLAKVVKGRTWTICGTPEYLAPEVVLSKGHNRGVDYWALGILIYEMVAGVCPFVGEDNMQIYKLIVENKITFPTFMTPDCRHIIGDFTKVSQLNRLGLKRPGIKAIRDHPWFIAFDWATLDALNVVPPIVPKVRNKLDTSNFEEYETDSDVAEPEACDWKPQFPFEVRNGRTDFTLVKQKSMTDRSGGSGG